MLLRDKPCPGVLWGCGTSCVLSSVRCTYKVPLGIGSTEDVLILTSYFQRLFSPSVRTISEGSADRRFYNTAAQVISLF